MSKPTLIRSAISPSDEPSSITIDGTGGNYLVIKQYRAGVQGTAWGTTTYDSTPLDIILAEDFGQNHTKVSGMVIPVQDEITIDITQSTSSAHRVIAEVWSGVDEAVPYSDPQTHREDDANLPQTPLLTEHDIVGINDIIGVVVQTNNGTMTNGVYPPHFVLTESSIFGRGYYTEEDGENIEIEVDFTALTSTGGILSTFILHGESAAAEGPEITETTPLKAGQPLTITGTDFSASGNTVILSPTTDHEHTDAEEQTIDSEGATEIVTEGIVLPDGAGPTDELYLFVIDDDDNVSEPFPITVSNPAIAFSGIRNIAGTLHTGTVDIKVWTDDPTQNDAAALLDSDELELTAGDGLFASDDIGMVEDAVWIVLRYVDEEKLNTLVAAATVTDHQPE